MKSFLNVASLSSKDLILRVIAMIRFESKIVGFDILASNYRLNVLSLIVIFDCVTYLIINAYDVKEFWGSITQVCFCLVTWTFGYQVIMCA